jgi:hypothetical protein
MEAPVRFALSLCLICFLAMPARADPAAARAFDVQHLEARHRQRNGAVTLALGSVGLLAGFVAISVGIVRGFEEFDCSFGRGFQDLFGTPVTSPPCPNLHSGTWMNAGVTSALLAAPAVATGVGLLVSGHGRLKRLRQLTVAPLAEGKRPVGAELMVGIPF